MPPLTLTLIAAPGELSPADVAAVADALAGLGATPGRPRPLCERTACDLDFGGLAADQADAAARRALGARPVDVVVQPSAGRRKRLLVADMESTVIENEMLDELADFLGLRAEVAEITRRAMNDELDFTAALEARVALLKGLDATVLDRAAERIRIMPGAVELVATMRANGAYCALVSGGFRHFTGPIRERLGFDRDIANELVIEGGRLAGTVRHPVVTRETKLGTLIAIAAELALPLAATLAVGDGANDLPMIEAAGLGVAFHAKPAVAARARVRIEHCDLTALLYAQGYREDEIRRP
ncbi:MAG: phosphoserine phosphatase SerB [Rhodospirillales bacterium]|nr:phosphoserine phosphatase SerB [Rhodospirillales bacterium]